MPKKHYIQTGLPRPALFFFWLLSRSTGAPPLKAQPEIQNYTESQGKTIPGLLPSSDNRVSRRYIFQIHGINTPDPNWGESLLSEIPKYGYTRTVVNGPDNQPWIKAKLSEPKTVTAPGLTCQDKDDVGSHNYCVFDHFGKYRRDIFDNPTTHDQVTVFTYFWRGDLWKVTGAYLNADLIANTTDVKFPDPNKSLLNATLKSTIIDSGLSDAAGYLSGMGALEREGIETTLCAMFADAIATPDAATVPPGTGCLAKLSDFANALDPTIVEFNFLSHSLGSRMLYDVLSAKDPKSKTVRTDKRALNARTFLAGRTRAQIMAANQLPLLAASEVSITPTAQGRYHPSDLGGPRSSLFDLRRGGATFHPLSAAQSTELAVISFQDPDDLLGFKASDTLIGEPLANVRFVDIVHRNTPQWLYFWHGLHMLMTTSLKRRTR